MSVMRSVLLAISENRWMRETRAEALVRPARRPQVHAGRGVRRHAARRRRARGRRHHAVFTRLGENVTDAGEADRRRATTTWTCSTQIKARGTRCEPSIKLTQLGLDIDTEQCLANLRALAERAHATGQLPLDRHGAVVVRRRHARPHAPRCKAEFPRVGVCLQAYLYRTMDDLKALIDARASACAW